MISRKVLVVLEDQGSDGSQHALDQIRVAWEPNVPVYMYGKTGSYGFKFTTPDGETLAIIPEGCIIEVVNM